jgi:hypothetical protein
VKPRPGAFSAPPYRSQITPTKCETHCLMYRELGVQGRVCRSVISHALLTVGGPIDIYFSCFPPDFIVEGLTGSGSTHLVHIRRFIAGRKPAKKIQKSIKRKRRTNINESDLLRTTLEQMKMCNMIKQMAASCIHVGESYYKPPFSLCPYEKIPFTNKNCGISRGTSHNFL